MELPPDVIRLVFSLCGDWTRAGCSNLLELKDRMRAMAVCKGWQQALAQDTIHSLSLDGSAGQERKVAWVASARPAVARLEIKYTFMSEGAAPALANALQAVQAQALEELVIADLRRGPLLSALQGRLAAFPKLRRLEIGLSHVHILELPRLSALTSLELGASSRTVRVRLARLPALQELELHGGVESSMLQLLAGDGKGGSDAAPSRLRRLVVSTFGDAVVHFAALPALRWARLCVEGELRGGESIAKATALRVLELGGDHPNHVAPYGVPLSEPWVAQVLRAAPPSLRFLSMFGDWEQAEVGALCGLTQLRALRIFGPGNFDWSGGVWRNLRVLDWQTDVEELPEALREATQLEMLDWWAGECGPSEEALEVPASLPALRHVRIAHGVSGGAQAAELKAKIEGRLPRLLSLTLPEPTFHDAGRWMEFAMIVQEKVDSEWK